MSILTTELIAYASASHPSDDVSTTGGAIDTNIRAEFTQFSAPAKLALISDGADTRSVDVVGRVASGVLTSETVVLTGAVEVLSVATFERILSVVAQTTSASRTVLAKQGSGGSTIGTINLNEKGFTAFFISSFSTTGTQTRFEKIFLKNTNATLTLTSSIVTLTADPQARIRIGVAASVDDTATVANRLTSSGVTFVDDNVDQNVPGGGNLAAASRIGVWVEQALQASDAAFKTTFTTRLQGNSI